MTVVAGHTSIENMIKTFQNDESERIFLREGATGKELINVRTEAAEADVDSNNEIEVARTAKGQRRLTFIRFLPQ